MTVIESQGGAPHGDETGFIPGLEASRGVAALMVALFHVSQARFVLPGGEPAPLIGKVSATVDMRLLSVFANGQGAVVFFFVLSGFVLTLLLKRRPAEPALFAVNRVFRIYPAVVCTVILFVAVFALTGKSLALPGAYSAGNVLANMALLKNDINGVMWSLQLELIAAPMILTLFFACQRWGLVALAVPFFVLLPLSFVKGWVLLVGPETPLALLYSFVAGMFACLYGKRLIENAGFSRTLLTIYSIGFLLARPLAGQTSNWSGLFETICACGIIALLAYGPFMRRAIPVLSYYGRISYSFYLLHPLSLIAIAQYPDAIGALVQSGVPRTVLTIAIFLASVAAMTSLAHLQQVLVETPGVSLGKAIGKRFRPRVIERSPSAR